jgi:hypothetical protein
MSAVPAQLVTLRLSPQASWIRPVPLRLSPITEQSMKLKFHVPAFGYHSKQLNQTNQNSTRLDSPFT